MRKAALTTGTCVEETARPWCTSDEPNYSHRSINQIKSLYDSDEGSPILDYSFITPEHRFKTRLLCKL